MTKQISRAGGLLLAMLLALSMLTVCAGADTTDNWTDYADDTWYAGKENAPTYEIDTPKKLAGVAKLVNNGTTDFSGKPLTIAATLDMSNYFWVPIGTEEYPFLGTIRSADGAVVHEINGLKINTAYSNTGFVGYLGSGGEVSRLTLNGAIDVAANSTANIGGVCGYAVAGSKINSVTSNLAITVTGTGTVNVGGIVGAGSCALSKCVNGDATRKADGSLENPTFGALTVTADSANVGGIVGEVDGVTVKANIQDGETRNNANLTVTAATANVGGIAGSVPDGKTLNFTAKAEDSTEIDDDAGYVWSLGEKITVSSDAAANVGGYIGSASGTAGINNAVFLHEIEVKGTGTANVGGIVGFGNGNRISNASLTTSLTKTGLNSTTMLEEHSKTTKIAVTSTGVVCTGGIVGKAEDTTISGASVGDANPPAKGAQTTVISTGTVGGLVGSLDATSAMTGGKVQYAVFTKSSGGGTETAVGGAIGINAAANVSVAVQDITVTATDATNVGGVFGSNATTQLTVEVQDVTLTATNMTGGNVGGVFGSNSAALNETNLTKMENLTVTATGADGTLGGVVGSNTGALTSSEYSNTTGKLKLKQILVMSHLTNGAVGGVAGRTTAKIEGLFCEHIDGMICSIGISFDKEGSYVGGIAGKSSATIGKSYAEITITGKAEGKNSTVGGAVGLNEEAGTLENVNLIGTVTTNADGCVLGGAIGQNGGTLKNFSLGDALTLKVSDGDGSTLGGLVGENTGTLTFCYSSAELVSLQIAKSLTMGGLVGENSGTVSASYRDVAVTLSTSGTAAAASYVGGLIGKNSGTVEKCYVSVPVTAPGRTYTRAGGLIGWMSDGSAANCYTCAEVSANTDSAYVGGFIGEFDAGTITNCYSTAEVKHEGVAPAGGFFGRCDAETSNSLSRCLYAQTDGGFNDGLKDSGGGTMTELSAPAALKKLPKEDFADQAALKKEATGWDFSAVWRYGSGEEAAAYHYPELRRTADVDYVNYDLKWYATPDEERNYSISKESELAGLAALVNGSAAGYAKNSFEGKTVTLTGPIYMQSTKWVGIGDENGAEFEGTLDGGGFLISGLSMNNDAMAGLFGNMAGTVQNLTLEPFAVEGSGKTAALAANNSGTIKNVTVNLNGAASITDGRYVGGIAADSTGAMNNVTLNLTGTAAISGVDSVGGIVGKTTGAITGATVAINTTGAASITASETGSYAGGIAGKTTADITTAEVTLTGVGASITGGKYVGGIVGESGGAVIGATVALDGTTGAASIAASGTGSYAGGIAGKAASITGTAAAPVSVTLTGATVSITGVQYAGGIAGDTTGAIEHSTVALTGTAGEAKITASGTGSYAGGIVGNTTGAIEHSTVALDGTTGAASITASGDASYAGGIAGKAASITGTAEAPVSVTLTGATVSITGVQYAGGIAGNTTGAIEHTTVALDGTAGAASIAASGDASYAGGIAGKAEGNITGTAEVPVSVTLTGVGASITGRKYAGGIVGESGGAVTGATVALDGTTGAASVTASGDASYAGGIAGKTTADITTAEVTLTGVGASITGVQYAGGIAGNTTGAIEHGTVALTGTAGEAKITASGDASYAGGIAGKATQAITDAEVTLTGVGASITGGKYVGGIVGESGGAVTGATVALDGTTGAASITASGTGSYAGGIAGKAEGNITGTAEVPVSVTLTGATVSITGVQYAGGVAGNTTGAIEHTTVALTGTAGEAKITASGTGSYAGGIAGNTTGAIEHSTVALTGATGAASIVASGTGSYAGGIAGKATQAITDAEVTLTGAGASITGGQYVGGIVGNTENSITGATVSIDGKTGEASVTGTTNVGGIAGKMTGAITGTATAPVSVTLTGATVSVTGTTYVGGIAGELNGAVTGTSEGKVFVSLNGATVGDATVSGTENVGGAVGSLTGSISYVDVILKNATLSATAADALLGGAVGDAKTGALTHVQVKLENSAITATADSFTGSLGGIVGQSAADSTVANAKLVVTNGEGFTGQNLSAKGGSVGGLVGTDTGTLTGELDVSAVEVNGARLSLTGAGSGGGVAGSLATARYSGLAVKTTAIAVTNGKNVNVGGIAGQLTNSVVYGAEYADSGVSVTTGSGAYTVNVGGAVGLLTINDNKTKLYTVSSANAYQGLNTVTVSGVTLSASGADSTAGANVGGLVGKNVSGSVYNCVVRDSATTQGAASAISNVSGYLNAKVGGGVGSAEDADSYLVNNTVKCGIKAESCAVYRVGGLIGELQKATVRYNDVQQAAITVGKAVQLPKPATDVGGFVGRVNDTQAVGNNTARADVSVSCDNSDNIVYVGGFVGKMGDIGNNVKLFASYATGNVSVGGTAYGAYVGGFVGNAVAGEIASCYATGNADGQASEVRCGGFAGTVNGTTTDKAKVHNAYALGTTFNASGNTAYCGGFAGYNNGTLSAVYTTVEDAGVTCNKEYKGVLFGKSDSAVTGAYTKDGLTGGRLSDMDFDGAWAYLTGQNEGRPVLTAIHGLTMRPDLTLLYKPLAEGYLTVGTLEELGAVNCMLSDADFYKLFRDGRAELPPIRIKLTADLSLAGKIWTPIESLREGDIFEGNGKTISDLCRDAHGFVKTNSGTIQNLTLANAEVTGGSNVGLVCGTNSGTLRNVTVTGAKLTGTGGGLICGTNDGTLRDVSVSKSTLIGGASYAGGVCGVNNESRSITNASVDATVSVAATYVGGVVGENKGTVENAKVATVDTRLMGASLTGGIAALNDTSGTVQTSALWGDITVAPLSGARTVGGIVGDNKGTVTKCYDQAKLSVGKVAATVGGVVGTNTGTVSDCFTASGAVIRADGIQAGTTNKEIVGGIVGESTGGTLERCMNLAQVFVSKNAGYVTGQTFFGAIGGQISGTTLTNNLFDRQYSGSAIAYYDNKDAPVRNPNDAKVKAYYTQEMTKAVLPAELSGGNWTAAAGRFPILACFAEDPQALPCVSPGGAAASEVYQERCAAPTGLTSQYFKTTVTVTLACATEGAEIYYTTDGSMPDETKTKYAAPIAISATTTLKAIAIKPHCADSPVVAATYTEGEPPPVVSGGGGGAAPVPEKATVVVDGVEYDFGASTTENGVTSVTPDTKKLNAQIASAAEGGTVVVRIEKSADADTVAATLSLKSVETMAQKAMTPAVQAGSVSYELPAAAIDAKALVTALGAADTDEVSLSIAIKELPTTAVTLSSGTLVGQPIQFSVTAACGGKTTEVKTFESYVRRVIELTAQQAARVTTAVVLENGVQRPVPTRVYQKDGKWYAEISSLTNSTYALISNQVSFTDAAGKWFAPMVTELAGRGIISGRSNGIFDGEAGVTRAEFAAIVVKALGLPADGDASKFTDVGQSAWYYGAVGKAYEYGLVSGDETGRFTPEAGITRQEAMVIVRGAAALTGFAGTSGTLDGFPDVASIDAWALDAARWNVGSGLIQGDEAGRLCGQDKITRGEATTVILRLLQKSGLVDVRN